MGLDVTWEAEFAQAGWLLPWTGSNKQQAEHDTLKPMLQTATWKGKLYAVPDNTNTQLLWYRSDLVKTPPKTWTEMINDSIKLAKQGKPHLIEIQGAQYEGATVWFNTMLASAGGSVLTPDAAHVALGKPAIKALTIMKRLATSVAADPSLDVQQENDNRLAMEGGTAAFQLNYPFVYPSMKADNPKMFKNFKWAPYPEVIPGQPAHVTIGGIDLGVSSYSRYPKLAFQAALCLRRPGEPAQGRAGRRRTADDHQPVQRSQAVRRLPIPRRHPQGARERQRAAEDARVSGRVDQHLAPGVTARRHQPDEHREADGQPDQQRPAVEGADPVNRRPLAATRS